MLCSTAADSLKWYMTFLTHPEVLQLSRADINSMITPKFHPFYYSNGTERPCTEDALLFAQGMSTFGSPNTGHGVSLLGSHDIVCSVDGCVALYYCAGTHA